MMDQAADFPYGEDGNVERCLSCGRRSTVTASRAGHGDAGTTTSWGAHPSSAEAASRRRGRGWHFPEAEGSLRTS